MEDKEFVTKFEDKVRKDLLEFLQKKDALDEVVPQCPDVEEKWSAIVRAYIPDGAREFEQYPVTSLGWMMLIGMAMAFYWDTDWEANAAREDFYEKLRDERGYDNMDEAIIEGLLQYDGETAEKVSTLVAECGSRVYGILSHEHVEHGTPLAFGCYVAALHQLYLAGMAMELNSLGYHMRPLNQN